MFRFFLKQCLATFMLFVLLFLVSIPMLTYTVRAATLPIAIKSVFTTAEGFQPRSLFSKEDRINFHVDIYNRGPQIAITYHLDVSGPIGSDNPDKYTFERNDPYNLPNGLSQLSTPHTLPKNALEGIYGIVIKITQTGIQDSVTGTKNFAVENKLGVPLFCMRNSIT